MGRKRIAWRGDRGRSPWDTAALRQSQSLRCTSQLPGRERREPGSWTMVFPRLSMHRIATTRQPVGVEPQHMERHPKDFHPPGPNCTPAGTGDLNKSLGTAYA
jgi:hypothetical protein